jgi:hypothetical protein
MRLDACLLLAVSLAATAIPQTELVSEDYFPTNQEFHELQKASSKEIIENPDRLSEIENGQLFSDVGFDKYERREYPVRNNGVLSIEVVTLRDFRAAYSLLTLLRNSPIQDGPPGNAFATTDDGILFAQGREWIRIRGRGLPGDLFKRIAESISKRIGSDRQPKAPSLLSHFPKLGYDASSLRYFPGIRSYETFSGGLREFLKSNSDMEIAQARYTLDNSAGILFLFDFPTAQVAEDYFADLYVPKSVEKGGNNIFAKEAGPIVAVLDGTFDPGGADRILSSLKFSFSVSWVYERRNEAKTVWGVPVAILGTVVKSLFFVAVMCLASIAAGVCFGYFRFWVREHSHRDSPDRPEQDDIIQLRLR